MYRNDHSDLPGKLDPAQQKILGELSEAGGPDFNTLTAEEARAADAEFIGAIMKNVALEECSRVEDMLVIEMSRSIPLRIYIPDTGKPPFPVIVFYHGGG